MGRSGSGGATRAAKAISGAGGVSTGGPYSTLAGEGTSATGSAAGASGSATTTSATGSVAWRRGGSSEALEGTGGGAGLLRTGALRFRAAGGLAAAARGLAGFF
jgi:hypothetical protein